ncbi:hypothetical protein Patl1_32562 [Pistacia atlantica]|uniref:Uncharacterized protein n=1 Tax=Pistacia atlantica TaxID=434234 RepID=A0ACC1ARS8_9ROSI|nr:hypothetical protein Patl1_32562 [Pistacia atlantica]
MLHWSHSGNLVPMVAFSIAQMASTSDGDIMVDLVFSPDFTTAHASSFLPKLPCVSCSGSKNLSTLRIMKVSKVEFPGLREQTVLMPCCNVLLVLSVLFTAIPTLLSTFFFPPFQEPLKLRSQVRPLIFRHFQWEICLSSLEGLFSHNTTTGRMLLMLLLPFLVQRQGQSLGWFFCHQK